MFDKQSLRPFYTVLVLAFVCANLVAATAIGLRPLQEKNALLDRKKNILLAAGLYDPEKDIESLFVTIEPRLVDLETGEYLEHENPEKYKNFQEDRIILAKEKDLAGIGVRENKSLVYLVYEDAKHTKLSQIILPVRGKGLWSTMFAYIAIGADLNSIEGISFYQHGETPGLGGEIENKKWQATWLGKKVYDEQGNVAFFVGQGGVSPEYEVDAISGATFTANGVSNLIEFWFGKDGFKNYLERLHKENSRA